MSKIKKISIFLSTLLIILTFCIVVSGCYNGEFFEKERLQKHLIEDLPRPKSDMSEYRGSTIFVPMTEEEFEQYAAEVYEYLLSCNFQRLGARGEELGGLVSNYAVQLDTENLSDFRFEDKIANGDIMSGYLFIWADQKVERDGVEQWETHYLELRYDEDVSKMYMDLCYTWVGYIITD